MPYVTYADLASTDIDKGAALVATDTAGTVQDAIDGYIVAEAYTTAGVADDSAGLTAAVAAAVAAGKPLLLRKAHTITSSVTIAGDVTIMGREAGSTISFSSTNAPIFASTGGAVKLARINCTSGHTLLKQSANFTRLTVEDCNFTGISDQINYLVRMEPNFTGGDVTIRNNTLAKCTAWYGENTRMGVLRVEDNTMTDMIRHVIRHLDSSDPTDFVGVGKYPEFAFIERNKVYGINTDWPSVPSNQVARFIQANAREELFVRDNLVEDVDASSCSTAAVIYNSVASLTFERNTIRRVSAGSGTGNRVLSDKCTMDAATAARYHWISRNNVYDQAGVAIANSPTSIIHGYTRFNLTSENDIFRGCTCPAVQQWESVDAGITPENFVVRGLKAYDHEYPVVVDIVQQAKNVLIENIDVFAISNPTAASPNGGDPTRSRVVTLYISFDNARHIEGVTIRGVRVHAATGYIFAVLASRNATAATSEIKDYVVSDCEMKVATGLARFSGTVGAGRFLRNTLPAGTALFTGTLPSGSALVGNVPHGLTEYTDDTAAAAGNVPIDGEYKTGSFVKRRIA